MKKKASSTPPPSPSSSPSVALPVTPVKTFPYDGLSLDQQRALEALDLENIKACRFVLGVRNEVVGMHFPTTFDHCEPTAWGADELVMADELTAVTVDRDGTLRREGKAVELCGGEWVEVGAVVPEVRSQESEVSNAGAAPAPAPALPELPLRATGNAAPAVVMVARCVLLPCPFQPRKRFDEAEMAKLVASVKVKGVKIPLIVRERHGGEVLEIVDGERRWRAAEEAGIATLPVIVEDLDDVAAMELMLTSALQRDDLSPMEECDAFARALAQRDASGALVYPSIVAFARKIGVGEDLVSKRLMLLKLPPEGRAALMEEKVSYRVMRKVCEAPRVLVPVVCDAVLQPGKKYPLNRLALADDPLTEEDVAKLLEHLSRPLRLAPFSIEDETLVPVKFDPDTRERLIGGACVDCPFRSAAEAAKSGATAKANTSGNCMHVVCYKKKCEVYAAAELVRAKTEGATVLRDSEAERVLKGGPHGGMSADYVELTEPLSDEEMSPATREAKGKKPTWQQVASVATSAATPEMPAGTLLVPVVVAVDERGRVRRFAERKVSVRAAEKAGNGHMLSLATGRGSSVQMDAADRGQEQAQADKKRMAEEKKAEAAAERARENQRRATSWAVMARLVSAIEEQGVPAEAWAEMVELAERHAGQAGCAYVVKRRRIDVGTGDVFAAVRSYGAALQGSARMAFVVELFLALDFAAQLGGEGRGPVFPDYAAGIVEFYGVNVKAAEAEGRGK